MRDHALGEQEAARKSGDGGARHPHAATKRRLGLDDQRSGIIAGDLNQIVWPGVDLRPAAYDPHAFAYSPTTSTERCATAFSPWRVQGARRLRLEIEPGSRAPCPPAGPCPNGWPPRR